MHKLFDPVFPVSAIPGLFVILGAVFAIYSIYHRARMLSAFDPKRANPLESLKAYMEPHISRWETSTTFRFASTGLLAAVMIYLMVYHRHTRWAEATSITFISLILGTILRNWLDFEDKILLYDIERAFRENAQEGSD